MSSKPGVHFRWSVLLCWGSNTTHQAQHNSPISTTRDQYLVHYCFTISFHCSLIPFLYTVLLIPDKYTKHNDVHTLVYTLLTAHPLTDDSLAKDHNSVRTKCICNSRVEFWQTMNLNQRWCNWMMNLWFVSVDACVTSSEWSAAIWEREGVGVWMRVRVFVFFQYLIRKCSLDFFYGHWSIQLGHDREFPSLSFVRLWILKILKPLGLEK